MPGILYYLPAFPRPIATAADLAAWPDLAGALAGAEWSQGATKGPDGGDGLVLAAHPKPGIVAPRLAYAREQQTWHRVEAPPDPGAPGPVDPPGSAYWFGWWSESASPASPAPPGPEDLERRQVLPGHRVTLGDGNDWLIPAIHAPRTAIPHTMRLGADRSWRLEPLPEYAAIMAEGAHWYRVAAGELDPPPRSEWAEFACRLLALNYRVSPWEISALGLLRASDDQYAAVVAAALDFPAVAAEAEAQKKTGTAPAT